MFTVKATHPDGRVILIARFGQLASAFAYIKAAQGFDIRFTLVRTAS